MKRKHLLVSFVLVGLQSVSFGTAFAEEASPYPADAEASYNLPAIETYAERNARLGDSSAVWGVSKREVEPHNPFPFGGGFIDD